VVPDVRSYEERRPYALPDTLAELASPAGGPVALPRELGWTGRTHYDLDDPSDAAVFYERVLVDAVRADKSSDSSTPTGSASCGHVCSSGPTSVDCGKPASPT
jgi:hypothetical protein